MYLLFIHDCIVCIIIKLYHIVSHSVYRHSFSKSWMGVRGDSDTHRGERIKFGNPWVRAAINQRSTCNWSRRIGFESNWIQKKSRINCRNTLSVLKFLKIESRSSCWIRVRHRVACTLSSFKEKRSHYLSTELVTKFRWNLLLYFNLFCGKKLELKF